MGKKINNNSISFTCHSVQSLKELLREKNNKLSYRHQLLLFLHIGQQIKSLINDWEKDYPNRKSIIFNALKNISPSHMLDSKLYNFFQLQAELEKIDI